MKRMQFIANLAAAITLLASTSVLEAEPLLYATTDAGSKLVRIDVGAGTVSEIGKLGEPFALAIAISPHGGFFTVSHSFPGVPGTPQLASVNLATGAATPFGPNLGAEIFMGIGFSPEGTLYGVNSMSGTPETGSLHQFNLATGAATKVGVTGGCFEIMDLAFHPDGTMYGTAWDSLYRINRQTGQAQLVTKLQGLKEVMGLAIDGGGNFYVSEIVTNAPLWRVDPVTGAANAVAGVRLNLPHGLEFVPPPPLLYATTDAGSKLVRIDVEAGTVSEIGNLVEPFAMAIAISPHGGFFTVSHSFPGVPGTPQLASVNLATGAATPFGPNLGAEIFMGLGFSPEGTLYGVNSMSGTPEAGSLHQFNLATGAATKVGVTGGCFEIMDLAFHPDGTMYGTAWDSLYRINRQTGQAQLVTKLQGLKEVMGLAIDGSGNFYVSEIVTNAPLWRVDPVTGAANAVAGVRLNLPHGLEFIPPPSMVTAIRASQVEVCWNSTSNLTYQVQYRSALTTNLWTSLVNCVRSTGSRSCISDPVVVSQPQRFYRVVQTNCVP